ncbi:hypothetical protein B0I35DRAFT_404066 [Stachybotrys elegans]|uniref:Uncharacterized protein n=1 Tax=Stachybotrys elegans TaxID=80388 RepID=A0A8K0T2M0_9HYPO|nr:hypothetical protein B0I35DRAFT_404066 [Stachybotrys elegans]
MAPWTLRWHAFGTKDEGNWRLDQAGGCQAGMFWGFRSMRLKVAQCPSFAVKAEAERVRCRQGRTPSILVSISTTPRSPDNRGEGLVLDWLEPGHPSRIHHIPWPLASTKWEDEEGPIGSQGWNRKEITRLGVGRTMGAAIDADSPLRVHPRDATCWDRRKVPAPLGLGPQYAFASQCGRVPYDTA